MLWRYYSKDESDGYELNKKRVSRSKNSQRRSMRVTGGGDCVKQNHVKSTRFS